MLMLMKEADPPVYSSILDKQTRGIMFFKQKRSILFLASCWSSRQFMNGRRATLSFPEAVEAVRVRHLPESTMQEVERILAQPLDIAHNKANA